MSRPVVVFAALASLGSAAAASPAPTKVRSVEGITEYTLANGMQVLLLPDPTVATITVDTTFKVGSRNESDGEAGMAHLLEHMGFKGSPRHPRVWNLLETRGAADQNGLTGYDYTHFWATLAATSDNLDYALDLYADVMINASITDEDLATEVTVVRNELEVHQSDPASVLDDSVWSSAYTWHAYGRSALGYYRDIERVPAAALRAFHTRYYQPDNATLIVAGRFDVAAALATIDRTFGAIPKPKRVLAQPYSAEPPQDGERRVTIERAGDQYLVEVAYHTVSGAAFDSSVLGAATAMLAHEPSGRLYKRLVDTHLAASVSPSDAWMHDPAMLSFTAVVSNARDVDKVEAIMEAEIEGLGTSKLDPRELERWKLRTRKERRQLVESTAQLALALPAWIGVGDWRTLFGWYAAADQVTLADVSRVASAYFVKANRTVGRFVPVEKPVRAPATEAASVVDAVRAVREDSGAGSDSAGEAFVATIDNIDARTARGTLPSGITTALLAKRTRHAKVRLQLVLHWGDETSLRGLGAAPQLLGALMSRGTAHRSYEQLRDARDRLDADISITTDASGLTLRIDAVRDQLTPALALAREMMTEPALTAASLDAARREWIAAMEPELQDPEAVSSDAYRQIVSPYPAGDPRHPMSVEERIDSARKVTIGDVARFAKAFAGASHGELVVIGDFDAAAVTAQVDALAQAWPSKAHYARLPERVFGAPATRKVLPLVDRDNARIQIGHDFALRDTDPDYPAMLIANELFGDGEGSRLWERLREREGLSYGFGSWLSADDRDPAGELGAYAIVAPANMAKMEASLLDEFHRLATAPIPADELAHTKTAWLRYRDTALASDDNVLSMLAGQLYGGRGMAWSRALRAQVAALTSADVERVVKKYLAPNRLVIVEAVDPAKAAGAAPVAPPR
jgi:zinc protease